MSADGAVQPSANEQPHILIIDDEHDFAASLLDILTSRGYAAVAVHSAAEALEGARAQEAHIALIDIRLGHTSGVDLIKQLKKRNPELLCVMMTAYAAVDSAIESLNEGAYAYLRKPLEMRDVFATLNRCAERIQLVHDKQEAEQKLRARNLELEELNARLKTVVKSTQKLTICAEATRMGQLLVQEFSHNMGAAGGSLYLVQDNSLVLSHSLDPPHTPTRIPLPADGDTVFGKALASKEPVLIRNSTDFAGLKRSGWEGYTGESLLVLPLLDETGHCIALLSLHSKDYPPFTKQDREIGQILAAFSCEALRATRATEELRTSEERYRSLMEQSQEAIVVIAEGQIVFANRAAVAALSADDEKQIQGRPFSDFVAPVDRKMVVHRYLARMRGEDVPNQYEMRIQVADGTIKWTEISIHMREYEGNPAVQASLHDIDARKRAEEALRQSEERYRELVETMAEGIILGDEHENIVFANPKAEEVFGVAPNKLAGQNLNTFTKPEQFSKLTQQTSRRQQGEISTYEIEIARPNGEHRTIQMTAAPHFDEQGNYMGSLGTFHDITETRKLERQLQQAHKMEAIGVLAGGIAHDFNNILYAIIGNAELGLTEAAKDHPVRVNLEEILVASERAKELVDQILSFARRAEKRLVPVRISSMIREVQKLLRSSLPTTINIQVQNRAPQATVRADPTEIHQVLMNLCTNAGQAMMKEGGMLTIGLESQAGSEIDPQLRSTLGDEQYVVISVRDTGPGIAPEIGERVFEPYFTTKQHGEGTGLGLAVVHGIVTSLGGTVTYSSRPGEGTVFRVLLPQIQRASTEMINKEGKAPSGSEHILVVDDEASIASLVANMLVSLGYKVTTHTSSREALSDFRAQPQVYDLILTDQTMPEMTGEQLARELLQGQHDPPIILCTGFSQTITAKHAAELGISAYIQKPVTRRSLAKTVRQVLDEHKPSGS